MGLEDLAEESEADLAPGSVPTEVLAAAAGSAQEDLDSIPAAQPVVTTNKRTKMNLVDTD